jgi:Na+-driven multidrug efflux pump
MFGIAAGGVLNVLLDPLFIFGFGLGIAGAAVATGLSQCVGFAILLSSFVSGKTATKLSPAALSKVGPLPGHHQERTSVLHSEGLARYPRWRLT